MHKMPCADAEVDVEHPCLTALPIDALTHPLPFLQAAALRSFAICTSQLWIVLKSTPAEYQRACDLVKWTVCGGGASADKMDVAVAVGGGGWHPGGVAVAELPLSTDLEVSFRFVLETSNRVGDLLFGLTRCDKARSAEQLEKAMAIGYGFIMGREHAPASIVYGGSSCRCAFSRGDGQGLRIDYGPGGGIQVEGRLAKLRNAGEWVDFHVSNGSVRAQDFQDNVFEWGAKLQPEELWQPTVAWTGSKACVRVLRCIGVRTK